MDPSATRTSTRRIDPLPKYRRVEEDLRFRVLSGVLKQGDQLPSESELCLQYDVSRITIRRAIQELAIEGYLYSVSGKGTFVAEWEAGVDAGTPLKGFTNEMQELGYHAVTVGVELDIREADRKLAAILDIEPGDKVVELRRVRAVQDGMIIAYSINSFPFRDGFSTDPTDYYGSLYALLESFGVAFTTGRDYLEATLPPAGIAEKLQIEPTEPVLKSVKVSRTSDHSFAEYNICYYVGSRYRYFVTY
ncbi:MAG: GntR family transcriptional regulator [Pseudolysinimonas sp.]